MSERQVIEAQLRKKESEVASLEEKLKAAKVYVKALEDVLREVDKGVGSDTSNEDVSLRRGSSVAQAREVILERATPIHIDDLLEALGKEVTRETKASLTGSLAAYVRKNEIFTRPAPSTFGLIELGHYHIEEDSDEPPSGFGRSNSIDEDDEIPF